MKRVFFLSIALFVGLTGCSSAPETKGALYLLPKAEPVTLSSSDISQRPTLVVRPVKLASYLNDSGIVYRTSETQVIQARNNQWAHSISEQITQRVVTELRHKQTHYWPTEMNNLLDQNDEAKLQLTLNKFNGSYKGNIEIEGEWLLINAEGKVEKSAPIQISQPLQDEGYGALVDALSVGLEKLTSEIAQKI
ncbi:MULTISPECIES: PqiC family protein [Vibrio]|uniref:PqiC family protein n=1 Tax=Vibrio TaxID=662 RepID=UPI001CDCA2DB|nr:ABC-type transport auxiliary lipoprotein family protein [Vibrio chemaguriensis]MCA2415638.1 ABC-type transport auxiliary lipoprotein family protein [Vibrio chemaguriensis]MCA2427457.1 ABC-type transport auxiliary lipoprotein family protein [Vibrio chemaguriensis]